MKIYELTSSKTALTHIITSPEQPESDMVLYFERLGKSIVLNNDIYLYIQSAIISEMIGKNLAEAIVSDYPHLFKSKSLEFATSAIDSDSTSLFSNLSGEVKFIAQERLSKINKQIEGCPEELEFKIDRAELLLNCNEYAQAKLEFEELLPISSGYFKNRIQKGLKLCKANPVKPATIIQTPFEVLSFEHAEYLLNCGENEKALRHFQKILPFYENISDQEKIKDGINKCHVVILHKKLSEIPAKSSEAGFFKPSETATIYPIAGNLSAKLEKSGHVGYKFTLMVDEQTICYTYLIDKNAKIVAETCNRPSDLVLALKEMGPHQIMMSETIEEHLKTGAAYSV